MLTGVILAGGQNRRMGGRPKALLPVGHQSLIERQLAAMREICADMIVVANDPAPYLHLCGPSLRIVSDVFPNQGPLGGMHAALSAAGHEFAWIVACDMPHLSVEAARLMWNSQRQSGDFEATVPFIGGVCHPLHGIYHKRCSVPMAESIMEKRLRVQDFLSVIRTNRIDERQFRDWGIDPGFVANINTPEQYAQMLRGERK